MRKTKLRERVEKMRQKRLKVLYLTEELEKFACKGSFNLSCAKSFEIASNYYMKISEIKKECDQFKQLLNENLTDFELNFLDYMDVYSLKKTCSILKISKRKYYRIIEKIEKEMSGKWQD